MLSLACAKEIANWKGKERKNSLLLNHFVSPTIQNISSLRLVAKSLNLSSWLDIGNTSVIVTKSNLEVGDSIDLFYHRSSNGPYVQKRAEKKRPVKKATNTKSDQQKKATNTEDDRNKKDSNIKGDNYIKAVNNGGSQGSCKLHILSQASCVIEK